MPIEAQLPDGTILEFPDETADAVVQSRVREYLGVAPATPSSAQPRGSAASRFLAPIGTALKGAASLPGEIGGAIFRGEYGEATNAIGRGLTEPSIRQAQGAGAAASRGDLTVAALRALATLDVGGAGADLGDSVAEGDLAGAAGKATVLAAPGARVPAYLRPTAIARILNRRAAARILDVMRPRQSAVTSAEDVASEVASGLAGREAAGGIGVGSLDTLVRRAKARTKLAGEMVGSFQAIDTPMNVAPISRGLRAEAGKLETTPPPHTVHSEVDTGILDEFGAPIMGVRSKVVQPPPVTNHPALTAALRKEADFIDNLAAQYPDGLPPTGEIFKQRAATGRRVSKSYGTAPGEEAAAGMAAGQASREGMTRELHTIQPGSVIADREYRVFKTAWTNFERHRRGALTNRGLKGLKDLLAGRAAAGAAGALTGAVSLGPLGGVAGALGGVMLGESAYWGSLRASTYAALARHLNRGELDRAADILQRTSATYGVTQGIAERELHRRAERALREQAEGVVVP